MVGRIDDQDQVSQGFAGQVWVDDRLFNRQEMPIVIEADRQCVLGAFGLGDRVDGR